MSHFHRTTRKMIAPTGFALVLALLGSSVFAEELAKEGSFEGDWNVEGSTESVDVDGARVSIYRVEGTARVTNADSGMKREFKTRCVGVSPRLST